MVFSTRAWSSPAPAAGWPRGANAESDPDADAPVVAPLACSLYGERRTVTPVPGTRLAAICGEAPFRGLSLVRLRPRGRVRDEPLTLGRRRRGRHRPGRRRRGDRGSRPPVLPGHRLPAAGRRQRDARPRAPAGVPGRRPPLGSRPMAPGDRGRRRLPRPAAAAALAAQRARGADARARRASRSSSPTTRRGPETEALLRDHPLAARGHAAPRRAARRAPARPAPAQRRLARRARAGRRVHRRRLPPAAPTGSSSALAAAQRHPGRDRPGRHPARPRRAPTCSTPRRARTRSRSSRPRRGPRPATSSTRGRCSSGSAASTSAVGWARTPPWRCARAPPASTTSARPSRSPTTPSSRSPLPRLLRALRRWARPRRCSSSAHPRHAPPTSRCGCSGSATHAWLPLALLGRRARARARPPLAACSPCPGRAHVAARLRRGRRAACVARAARAARPRAPIDAAEIAALARGSVAPPDAAAVTTRSRCSPRPTGPRSAAAPSASRASSATGLLARGHAPRLITSHPGRPRARDRGRAARDPRLPRPPEARLRRRMFEDHLTHVPFTYLVAAPRRRRRRPRAVPTDALAAARWARATGRPAVLCYMGIPHRAGLVDRRLRLGSPGARRTAPSAVVALSEAAARRRSRAGSASRRG